MKLDWNKSFSERNDHIFLSSYLTAFCVVCIAGSKKEINYSDVTQTTDEALLFYDDATIMDFQSIVTSKPSEYLTAASTNNIHEKNIGYMNFLSNTSCSFSDISLSSQICETLFFRELIRNPRQSCL